MRRGDVVLVVAKGDFAKPRPAVIVQASVFLDVGDSISYCPLTSEVREQADAIRVMIEPRKTNGLRERSQVMVDKVSTVRTDRIRDTIGALTDGQMEEVGDALRLWLDLA